jgi:hypothetical protein
MDRLLDYLSEGVEGMTKAPGQLSARTRELYEAGGKKGGVTGALKSATAPYFAEGEALKGLLMSALGVSTVGDLFGRGLGSRLARHEDPAKVESDAALALGGYMAGGPKETSAGEVSVGDAARQITDAVNPLPKQMASFQRSLGEHLDKIITFAKSNGIDLDSIEGIGKAMKGSGDWIRNHYYNDMLGPVKNRQVSIAGTIKGYSGETATPSTATLGQLDARLSQVNAELDPAYSKGGRAGEAAVKSKTELNAEAAGLRTQLYKGIADATGLSPEEVAKTRGSFGALDSLAEKTNMAAAKERFSANRAARAPVTVNPLSMSGNKQFIADQAVNKLRGDVVGKQLRNATSKVKVKPYQLPRAKNLVPPPQSASHPFWQDPRESFERNP